jgi:putative transcriptional regulator
MANLSILKTSQAWAMRFGTLEALCRELRRQFGDLLSYEVDDGPWCTEPGQVRT